MRPVIIPAFTGSEESADATKKFIANVKVLNEYLEDGDKSFLVGENLTIADLMVAALLSIPYQVTFGAEFFENMETAADYLERIMGLPSFVRRFGYVKRGANAPAASTGAVVAAPAKKADDDLDDLFGDDDEPKEASKPKIVVKKPKKVVIAMSLVMLEVKPLDSDTNLDDLAKKIFSDITQEEGLFWKTEYKKEPVAFGIFKLIIGFSCEDEKVSVDDIVEKIEALEEEVQSVEITAFNKI